MHQNEHYYIMKNFVVDFWLKETQPAKGEFANNLKGFSVDCFKTNTCKG